MSRAFTLWLPGLLEGPQQGRVCLFQNPTRVSQGAEGRCRVTCISSLVRALWETFFSDVFSRTRSALTPALPPSPDQSHPPMPHQAQGGQSSSRQHLPHDGSAFSCSACCTAWRQRKGGQVQENWGACGTGAEGVEAREGVVKGPWRLGRRVWTVGVKGPSG